MSRRRAPASRISTRLAYVTDERSLTYASVSLSLQSAIDAADCRLRKRTHMLEIIESIKVAGCWSSGFDPNDNFPLS
jgi:hypothetical protein